MQKSDPKRVSTGRVRLSYAHLTKPRVIEEGKPPKYSVTLLIPKSDTVTMRAIEAAIQAAINEGVTSKWGGVRPAQTNTPVHDGDGRRESGEPFGEECRGCWVMTASSNEPPGIVDANLNAILNPTEIYSGMYGRVSIRFFPYFNKGRRGIGAGLGNVQKLEDGEPLSGRTSAQEDFGGGAEALPPQGAFNPITGTPYPPAPTTINPITGMPYRQPGIYGLS